MSNVKMYMPSRLIGQEPERYLCTIFTLDQKKIAVLHVFFMVYHQHVPLSLLEVRQASPPLSGKL